MDKQYFLNAGIPLASPMPAWQNITPSPSEQPSNCFPNPLWKKSTENYAHYESALSSMVSSPAPSNSAVSGDGFAIRELIGKLGTICNAGEISPALLPPTSCYTTPLNSPPKLHMPIMDHFLEENPKQLNSPLPAVSGDPGFAERAAKFSCFGSRSFNGRNTQYGVNNTDFQYKPINPLMGIGNLGRVSSSPSLKTMGGHENKNSAETHMELCTDKKFSRFSESAANSNEESSVSEQNSKAETGLKSPNDLNSRKRRSVTRGKSKEMAPSQADNATKEPEAEEDQKTKKIKKNEIDEAKTEEETKPPEPLKDYIHVRARRGQATDSHSLAERVRREKISERMKLLQDLVPGCNKVTGKALMLDEIINYVQSLQRQVEFLSMKLSTVNPRLDFNMDSLLSKDLQIHQPNPNGTLLHSNYPLDSSVSALYGHQQNPLLHANFSSGAMGQGPVGPLDASLCCNLGLQLPSVDGFGEGLPQFPTFCEDDLQSIVHMGFGENPNRDTDYSQGFPATNQMSHMKTEL